MKSIIDKQCRGMALAFHVYFRTIVLVVSFLIIPGFPIIAENSTIGAGGESWAFLKMGVGARAIGMGGAFVAVSDDSTAPYWNPAGLGLLKEKSATMMVVRPEASSEIGTHEYLSFCQPTEYGNLGVSVNFFRIDNIEYTKEVGDGFEFLGKSDADTEWALNFSYGIALPESSNKDQGNPWVFLGTSGRIMGQQFMGFSTRGLGADAGLIMTIIDENQTKYGKVKNLRLGYVLKYNSSRSWKENGKEIDEYYSDPASIGWQLGVSSGLEPETKFLQKSCYLNTALSIMKASEFSPLALAAGAELNILQIISFRCGAQFMKYNKMLTYGLGFVFSMFQLDYAFAYEEIATKHRVSLSVRF
jgi:hypothetical protein